MVKLDKVKWGFIGCGEVTEKKSGPAFALIEGSEVVAVMSRDKEKAQSYAKRHNIPRWYSDPQQLIGDEDVNAIYIATPPSSHATFAIMAMKAGKPVYIENQWQPAMRTAHASTAYHKKLVSLVSSLTTDVIFPISKKYAKWSRMVK